MKKEYCRDTGGGGRGEGGRNGNQFPGEWDGRANREVEEWQA